MPLVQFTLPCYLDNNESNVLLVTIVYYITRFRPHLSGVHFSSLRVQCEMHDEHKLLELAVLLWEQLVMARVIQKETRLNRSQHEFFDGTM